MCMKEVPTPFWSKRFCKALNAMSFTHRKVNYEDNKYTVPFLHVGDAPLCMRRVCHTSVARSSPVNGLPLWYPCNGNVSKIYSYLVSYATSRYSLGCIGPEG